MVLRARVISHLVAKNFSAPTLVNVPRVIVRITDDRDFHYGPLRIYAEEFSKLKSVHLGMAGLFAIGGCASIVAQNDRLYSLLLVVMF